MALMPSTHRRRDSTRQLRRVGGLYWAGLNCRHVLCDYCRGRPRTARSCSVDDVVVTLAHSFTRLLSQRHFKRVPSHVFYQRVSIASYASAGIARAEMSIRLSVRPSVTLRYCIKTKKASVMISSPSESLNILVSRNIWLITKFDRGHPERWRFLRLGWVRTGDFGDFSTNKPPHLRSGAR